MKNFQFVALYAKVNEWKHSPRYCAADWIFPGEAKEDATETWKDHMVHMGFKIIQFCVNEEVDGRWQACADRDRPSSLHI